MDISDALVVYEGHSPYGQGPAFGPEGVTKVPDKKKFPVNPGGVHFRMGCAATDTACIADLVEHSVMPTEHDLTTADPKSVLPDALVTATSNVQAQAKSIKTKKTKPKDVCRLNGACRSMDTCRPALSGKNTAQDDQPLKSHHYYVHQEHAKPEDFLTAVKVGSADLDTAMLACRLFFMASCSSKVHFHPALLRRCSASRAD